MEATVETTVVATTKVAVDPIARVVGNFLKKYDAIIQEKGCIPMDYFCNRLYALHADKTEEQQRAIVSGASDYFYEVYRALDGTHEYNNMPVLPAKFPAKPSFKDGVPVIKVLGMYRGIKAAQEANVDKTTGEIEE